MRRQTLYALAVLLGISGVIHAEEAAHTTPTEPSAKEESTYQEPAPDPFVVLVYIEEKQGYVRALAQALAEVQGFRATSFGQLSRFGATSTSEVEARAIAISIDGVPLSRLRSPLGESNGRFEFEDFDELLVDNRASLSEIGQLQAARSLTLLSPIGVGYDDRWLRLSSGIGSHGARDLRARWLGGKRGSKRAYAIAGSYSGAEGDYEVADGAPSTANNNYDRLGLYARASLGDLQVGSRSRLQYQGSALIQDRAPVDISDALQLFDGRYSHRMHRLFRVYARGYAGTQRQKLRTSQLFDQHDRSMLAANVGFVANPFDELAIQGDFGGRHDSLRTRAIAEGSKEQSLSANLNLQWNVIKDRLFLDIGMGGYYVDDFEVERFEKHTHPTVRLGLGAAFTEALTFRGSFGRFARPERSNDFEHPQLGNEFDVAARWSPPFAPPPLEHVYVESSYFQAQVSQGQRREQGAAVVVAFKHKSVAVVWSRSFHSTRRIDQRPAILPRHRQTLRASVTPSVAGRDIEVWSELLRQEGLDDRKTQQPGAVNMMALGLNLRVTLEWTISIELRNAGDVQTTAESMPLLDPGGYPIPGRSGYLRLQWDQ